MPLSIGSGGNTETHSLANYYKESECMKPVLWEQGSNIVFGTSQSNEQQRQYAVCGQNSLTVLYKLCIDSTSSFLPCYGELNFIPVCILWDNWILYANTL